MVFLEFAVNGLANIDGDVIQDEEDLTSGRRCSRYKLTGIVVHSGQASGGHYYSYVLHRHTDGTQRWYKFDDGEVSECHMDDDEEMKSQCFGGEYMGEVFDHLSKRMNCRRQKRWWNAYILFYTRLDVDEQLLQDSFKELSLDWTNSFPKMPAPIERSVRRENVRFMHNRNQFSVEYFQFIKKLVICNNHFVSLPAGDGTLSPEGEEIAMMSMQLVSRFLFITGWHTKKSLRGPAIEWYEALSIHLRGSRTVRSWFAQNVLFAPNYKARFTEYMLECPSSEVRMAFVKVIMFVAHFSLQDGPSPLPYGPGMDTGEQLSNALIQALNVPALLMQVAMDEGPGPAIKYQYAELGKLYQVVSLLVRCCDVSSRCQPSTPGVKVLPNPYIGDQHCSEPLMPIQPQVADMLYVRPAYMKKIMEEANAGEDTARLLKFCSWENPVFSSAALAELLWQISYSYTYELRPYLDLLLHLLLMEDSWQSQRIVKALKGISEDREGLFDTVHRSKSHHQKRAYQCIKAMVSLFTTCNVALRILQTQAELRRRWSWAVNWLHEELERRPYPGSSQYGYNSWSPPAPSNETSNGYFLERSNSAKMTLQKALEICPDEEGEGEEVAGGEDGEGGPGSPVPEDGVVPQVPSPSPVPGTATVGKLSRGSGDTRASTTTQSLSNPLVYSSIQPQERESPLSPLQPPLSSHVQFMPQRRLSGGDQRGSDKLFGFRPEDGQSTEEA
ncbi:unnamed protein product [Darwinula stevensoni]|uniref:USP domain-containing protein n=1 Tax=Darwinula stevensoni TaxID=69355 RepID=A0A7R8WXZ0_9CRUS|nr:unnamed protein product [Darwinula stevensoni]CAG0878863.1 unnamed protein product [Darwinula stevensoni]